MRPPLIIVGQAAIGVNRDRVHRHPFGAVHGGGSKYSHPERGRSLVQPGAGCAIRHRHQTTGILSQSLAWKRFVVGGWQLWRNGRDGAENILAM